MLCHASPHLAPCVRDETLDEVLQAAERLDPLVSFLPTACSRRTDPHPIPHRIDREFGCLLMEDFGRSWTSPNLPRCVMGRSLTPSLPFGSYNFYKGFASLTSCCFRHAGRFLSISSPSTTDRAVVVNYPSKPLISDKCSHLSYFASSSSFVVNIKIFYSLIC